MIATEFHGLKITCNLEEFVVFNPPEGPAGLGRLFAVFCGYLDNAKDTFACRYCRWPPSRRRKGTMRSQMCVYECYLTLSTSHRFRPLRRKPGRVNRRERCVATIFSSITHDIYTMPLFHRPGLGTSGAGVSRARQGYDRNSLYY